MFHFWLLLSYLGAHSSRKQSVNSTWSCALVSRYYHIQALAWVDDTVIEFDGGENDSGVANPVCILVSFLGREHPMSVALFTVFKPIGT